MKNTTTRRGFIKQVAATGVGLTIGGMSFKATSAKSYANIMGSNERVNMAVMGTNGRGAVWLVISKVVRMWKCVTFAMWKKKHWQKGLLP